jgi:chromosome partitioning protein
MITIAIANQKGGCGKTTTAINLAAELGQRNERVLLIDMDPQGHASLGLGIIERDLPGLYEVFCDDTGFPDVVMKEVITGVDLIPANILLATTEAKLVGQVGRERLLLEQLEAFGRVYDYVLIDCPPSLGLLSINALRAADRIISPLEASLFALDGIQQLKDIVDLLCKKYQLQLPVKVLPTMFDLHTRFAHTLLDHIREQLPVAISAVRIRHTVRVREAAYLGKPLNHYAPYCTAALDYRELAEEIIAAERPRQVVEPVEILEDFQITECEDTTMGQVNVKTARQMIVLTFDDIDCRRLQLAGDFNNWIPDHDIETRNVDGHWQKVFTAEPGVYEYRLIIDGKWQHDPTNPAEIPNELGGVNSLLQVPVHL